MIELTVPGRGTLQLEHLVCDVNGTLAVDGSLIDGLARALTALRIAVLSPEGLAPATLLSADLLVTDIFAALDLLEKPLRVVASLRK